MFFLRKDSILNNFKKLQNKTYKNCCNAINRSKYKKNTSKRKMYITDLGVNM